jgi:hypothetical protein
MEIYMSHGAYGRVTGLQSLMLGLAGISAWNSADSESKEALAEEMQRSRSLLTKMTGIDFGFDLRRWHEHLLTIEEYIPEYTFEYAWNGVRNAVEEQFDSS